MVYLTMLLVAQTRMIKCEGYGKKKSWRNLKYYLGIWLKELRKTAENLSQPFSGSRYEPGTFQIRKRSANHSAMTFGLMFGGNIFASG
jgi:hypothetical protein